MFHILIPKGLRWQAFQNKWRKFRRKGFVINFCRTFQKRFYIKGFATNSSNVSRETFVTSFLPLLSLLLWHPSFCCPLYSSRFLYPFYPFISSTYCTSFTFFTLCTPWILFTPLRCLCILWLFYLLAPPLLLLPLFHLERIKEVKSVKEVKEIQGDRRVIGYKDSEEEWREFREYIE